MDSHPWSFPPTPKDPSSGKAFPVEETLARAHAARARIPVTRVSDLTPLDPLGLPVYAAVTPLALDLAVHLGKGSSPGAAQASAIMEAIERVSAETVAPSRLLQASFTELRRRRGEPPPIDPASFALPPDSAYRPDRSLDWIEAHDLLAGSPVRLPADLATNPPREGLLVDVDTNGLASGNVHLEAVVHALCEVIERDAVSQLEFCALFADPDAPRPPSQTVDPATLPEATRALRDRCQVAGLELLIEDITHDLQVATFACRLVDLAYPSPRGPATVVFAGFGTHPDAEVAVFRAAAEAIQSRLSVIQGARDSYNLGRSRPRRATQMDRLRHLTATPRVPFASIPSQRFTDLRDELEFLLARLRATGIERCLAVDLTREDIGIPVVRVRVPGLAQFIANMRSIGPRCRRWLL